MAAHNVLAGAGYHGFQPVLLFGGAARLRCENLYFTWIRHRWLIELLLRCNVCWHFEPSGEFRRAFCGTAVIAPGTSPLSVFQVAMQ